MTEAEWLTATNTFGPLWHLHKTGHLAGRKRALFVAACCHRIEDYLPSAIHRQAVRLGAGIAEGTVTNDDRRTSTLFDLAQELDRLSAPSPAEQDEGATDADEGEFVTESHFGLSQVVEGPFVVSYWALDAADWMNDYTGSHQAVLVAGDAYRTGMALRTEQWFGADDWWEGEAKWAMDVEVAAQVALIHDIFGNPFRPVAFDPAWRTEHTVGIASKMYDERDFAAMPILADALEEAGCDSADILAHCREPGTHVRGCWVVDLVLGKA